MVKNNNLDILSDILNYDQIKKYEENEEKRFELEAIMASRVH